MQGPVEGTREAAAAAPVIDNTHLPKPIQMRCDEEGSITVKISGFPKPTIRWQIGRKKVKESSKYHLTNEGLYHTLVITRATSDLEQGVWVIATNQYGEDCCLLEVKTYSTPTNNDNGIKTTPDGIAPDTIPQKASSARKKKPRSSSSSRDTRSVVSLDTWKTEMEQRNRIRSVDDVTDASLDVQSTRNVERGRANQNGSLRDRRYSSTEAVHDELQSKSIPPLSMDEHSFASESSIPGTPYEERKMPEFTDTEPQKVDKVTTSRRSRSASLTDRSKNSEDKPPRPTASKILKNSTPVSADKPDGKLVEDPDKMKPPKPPVSSKVLADANHAPEGDGNKPKKKKVPTATLR